ncbi:RVP_2 domain-containing protein [Cephalotus follicularis]|uniref:RVP_2 domain-containing protein n=1 Tax=Cephalotus follicularis TaxID=3775 RepID=A0A1Q3DH19_CEPFO|nr:RVP_2 domain-containing protein [Cephalotus follicularis]
MSNQCTRSKMGVKGEGGAQQSAPARTFAMIAKDVENPNEVLTGTFSVCSNSAYILFDTGATHSFVSLSFVGYLSTPSQDLEIGLAVETPNGNTLMIDKVYRSCELELCDRKLLVDLIPLAILHFDIILGMDWISANHASVDCFKKEVRFAIPNQSEFILLETLEGFPVDLVIGRKCV